MEPKNLPPKTFDENLLKSIPADCKEFIENWLKSNKSSNTTGLEKDNCADTVPTSSELFHNLPPGGIILYAFLFLFTILILVIFFEEIRFIIKNFKIVSRKRKTIWLLALFPVFAGTGLLGVCVPRAGTLVDMVANVFLGTCIYNFGRLMTDYMGGPKRMWTLIEDDRELALNTPPLCCCCVCLPKVKFSRKVYYNISLQIMQVAIVRPLLMFFAAVMWADGTYNPGNMSGYNGYIYITVLNLISTVTAVYGLMLLRRVLTPELEVQFKLSGKIACLQLVLLFSVIPNLIISILVSTGVIACSSIFPSKTRGEGIYHAFLVLIMFLLALLGRHFFRRASDGSALAQKVHKTHDDPNENVTQDMNQSNGGSTEMSYLESVLESSRPSIPPNVYNVCTV